MSVGDFNCLLGNVESANRSMDDLSREIGRTSVYRVSTEVTFCRGDLRVCPLGGFIGAQE